MTLARECDACHGFIQGAEPYYDLVLMVKSAMEVMDQDPLQQQHGDYCGECVRSGKAIADLVGALKEAVST